MSIFLFMTTAALVAGPVEAISARRKRRFTNPYRNRYRRKKSPPTYHSREL